MLPEKLGYSQVEYSGGVVVLSGGLKEDRTPSSAVYSLDLRQADPQWELRGYSVWADAATRSRHLPGAGEVFTKVTPEGSYCYVV